MKSRNVILSLVLILGIVIFLFIKWRINEPVRKEAFNRKPSYIEYTADALCLMNCRHISKEDINTVMRKGVILFSKSNLRNQPCPTFTLQGFTDQGENIRVFVTQCRAVTRILACYNLKKDFQCDCSGENVTWVSLGSK
jgi:hypothetical protein